MNYVNFIIDFAILLFLTAFSGTVAARPDITSRLNHLMLGLHTYQAAFKQITLDNKDRITQKSQGHVAIMRPNRFRWETDSPIRQIIIINGKKLCVYDVDLAQAVIYPMIGKANINPASLFLGSVDDLNKKFPITITSSNEGDNMEFQLFPKKGKDLNFKSLCLRFIKNHLVEMTIFNNLNEKSIFQFNQIRMNAPLSIQLFTFKPPYTVSVFKQ